MQKRIKRLFTFVITFILLYIFIIVISVIDIEEANNPKGAVRKGDLKEYYWLKKISVSKNSMRICIYNDYNNGSLKFEITAKRLYAASQRVL